MPVSGPFTWENIFLNIIRSEYFNVHHWLDNIYMYRFEMTLDGDITSPFSTLTITM